MANPSNRFSKPANAPSSDAASGRARRTEMLDDEERDNGSEAVSGRPRWSETTIPPAAPAGGFFEIYKQGQGSNTRVWSGFALGLLICWGAYYVYQKFTLFGSGSVAKTVQAAVVAATIIGFGLVGYWLLARHRRVCDFLIATEGEMKKVNWTSRKEIIGSTKVVIFLVIVMSFMLTVVDVAFMTFFGMIGVLKGPTILDALRKLF